MMDRRDPYDGKPYYCALCGLGIDEFMACEEPDCKLEPEEKAQQRAKTKPTSTRRRGES